jgi:hypothetical protein
MGILTDDMKRLVHEQQVGFPRDRVPGRIAEPCARFAGSTP